MRISGFEDELPGQSDELPGPPGSDRAWELVSISDSSGNPIALFFSPAFSDAGDRAVYGLAGGSTVSPTGSFQNFHYAERTASGWQTIPITPTRDQLAGSLWRGVLALPTSRRSSRKTAAPMQDFPSLNSGALARARPRPCSPSPTGTPPGFPWTEAASSGSLRARPIPPARRQPGRTSMILAPRLPISSAFSPEIWSAPVVL